MRMSRLIPCTWLLGFVLDPGRTGRPGRPDLDRESRYIRVGHELHRALRTRL